MRQRHWRADSRARRPGNDEVRITSTRDKFNAWNGGTLGQWDIFVHDLVEFSQNAMFAPFLRHPVHRARWRKHQGSRAFFVIFDGKGM